MKEQKMIRFNTKTEKWEGLIDGVVVSSSTRKFIVERRMAQRGASNFAPASSLQINVSEKKKAEFSVAERFQFLEHFVKMVATGKSNALFISGPGGLGKTHTVLETMRKCGKKEISLGDYEGDFLFVRGFTTAKGMYRTLYENNGKTIIFDDADSSFKDVVGINLLKAALDSHEKRIISWYSETKDDTLPSSFEFIGRVIFISNFEMTKVPQPLVSRCMKVSLDMNTEEKVDRIAQVLQSKECATYLDASEKKEVIDFVKANADKFTDLNIRTAINLTKIRASTDNIAMFKRLALYNAMS
jgi:DNA polymerase III delta prime subunit